MYNATFLLYHKTFVTVTVSLYDGHHTLSYHLVTSKFKIRDKEEKRKEIEESK